METEGDLFNHNLDISGTDNRNQRANCKRLSSTSREVRVKAEKERRDRLKSYMEELTTLVPAISRVNKRPDKTSILRLSANWIMLNHYFRLKSVTSNCCGKSWPENIFQSFNDVLEDVHRAFLIAIFPSGKTLYVSESVEKILGYNQVDLLNDTLLRFVPDEDLPQLKENLSECSPGKKVFTCRLVEKGLSRSDPGRPINMTFEGYFHNFPSDTKNSGKAGKPKDQQVFQESLFIAIVSPAKEDVLSHSTMLNSTKDEYFTRHHIDGRILETDHRISFVTGYLIHEVTGNQAFDYMVPEDRIWSEINLKALITSESAMGIATYRLLGPSKNIVCLRTRGFLEKHDSTDTLLCINTPLSWKEARTEMIEQRNELLKAGLVDPSSTVTGEAFKVAAPVAEEVPSDPENEEFDKTPPQSSPTVLEASEKKDSERLCLIPDIMYFPMSPETLDTVLLSKALSSKENIATKVVHWYPVGDHHSDRRLCKRDMENSDYDINYSFCEPFAKVPCSTDIVSLEENGKLPLTSVTNIINRTSLTMPQEFNK